MTTARRPSFKAAWGAFQQVRGDVKEVGKFLGGKIEINTELGRNGGYTNACPIRMSYVLNYTGFPIHAGHGFKISTGADRKNYLIRINDMVQYLKINFGAPDKVVDRPPLPDDFWDMQGIILVEGDGWDNARGHVTLWDGSHCADTCHMYGDPKNWPFSPQKASIWVLK
ncbi:Type VI secretion system (T6SS), amidase effector protein 4 [Andreprevotia lacus DSM 23236]|jgi:hypothetical protein|uniref:Type VI secretion system (T6SS), amidase effector protein 4 n=1 Tax=Andreprevotia lacus DSM 23236 TaxID=1121001 RepID=A0A1W1X3R1_9NEIS|nr:type VI secretion system amidase effector protein Tae4 [Andreprevotia lacus]SMC18517.1 Type VI secretion system (T6SS), amidase effector protein 4 [Andreprevotia lacus DSM 23236]